MNSIVILRSQFRESLSNIYNEKEADALFNKSLAYVARVDATGRALLEDLNAHQVSQMNTFLARLMQAEPLEYITGTTTFCGLQIAVSPDVLIPRPETEQLVSFAMAENSNLIDEILDVCTGSGCIAHALKKHFPSSYVRGVDISPNALAIAQANTLRNKTGVSLHLADVLNQHFYFLKPKSIDLFVSNPPYVTEADKAQMHENVLKHEPHLALFVKNEDPLIFYKAIISIATIYGKSGAWLGVEINEQFGNETARLFESAGCNRVELRFDFNERHRFVTARLPH